MLISGSLLLLAGFAIAIHLQTDPAVRALVAVAWIGGSVRRLLGQASGFRAVKTLIVSPGAPDIVAAGRAAGPCALLSGSLLLQTAGWLRLRLPCGRQHTELLLASDCAPDDWRRLQILWRWGRRPHDSGPRP